MYHGNKKKEACRNFQRGSCQYGDRCKFLHVTPQQPKSNNNPFGFGTNQQQQQKPNNPFGFGVQSNNKPSNTSQQFKPFENKWTRGGSAAGAYGTPSSQQPDNRASQPPNHKCTDPDSCKRLIAEDFQNERPLWKLTCYGHLKCGPCDIIGDISYEELRAGAYEDAKNGLSLQSIVERERNLLNAKLIEFDALLRNPYTAPSKSVPAIENPFPVTPNAIQNPFSVTPNATQDPFPAQNTVPPSVSSFGQLSASLNRGFGTTPAEPSNNAFRKSSLFSNFGQASGGFGTNNFPPANSLHSSQTLTDFGTSNFPSTNAGPLSSQLPNKPFGSSFSTNLLGFGNSDSNGAQNISSSAFSMQNSSNIQPLVISNAPNSTYNAATQATTHIQSVNTVQREAVSVDTSIWLKEKWTRGEDPHLVAHKTEEAKMRKELIPEEEPPEEYVF